MNARIRGEHDTRWRSWRPNTGATDASAPRPPNAAVTSDALATVNARAGDGRQPHRRPVVGWLVVLIVALLVVSVATAWPVAPLSPGPAPLQLPRTPRAWLDSYEAAAIDNPPRVCSQLFAPQLAQTYANAVHGSCRSYFAAITSFSVVVRRILLDGGTAVLELRQTVRPKDWAVVLDRRHGGWQAVDLLTGNPAR